MGPSFHALSGAKHTGDVIKHVLARRAFLRHVLADTRTRELFQSLGRTYELDAAVDDLAAVLDAIVVSESLATRVAVRTAPCATDGSALHRQLLRLDQRIWQRVAETRLERAGEMVSFVATVLVAAPSGGPPTPMLAWLVDDLMKLFETELTGHVWGVTVPVVVPFAPTLTEVRKGQRPKHDGTHIEQYVEWFYQSKIAVERVSLYQIAKEYRSQKARNGITLAPKSHADQGADTSTIRDGIAEAERLLTLPAPPWQWPASDLLAALKIKGGKR